MERTRPGPDTQKDPARPAAWLGPVSKHFRSTALKAAYLPQRRANARRLLMASVEVDGKGAVLVVRDDQ